tara:strand:- start:158 stop:598 length:441 start_codon:yes stop_codon:yes gene_type:complete
MIIVDFESDHAKELYDGIINDDRNRPPIMISQFVDEVVVKNLAFTGVLNGKIIACGGIYPIWNGVGDAWFIGSNVIYEYPILVTKTVKKYLDELMDLNNFHRVQAYVRHDWQEAQRWIKVLGMQNEGTARKYSTDGRNHILFAKVK